ncbi:MAG: type VI secretion system-associated protein TagF [Halomonadaceae bacterium]|nr:MAG: type VI secretion system-associated protein TagF [Halomonadaceae bacterium]
MAWGYMGKVPNRGDFLSHNVSPALGDLMLEWCQATLAVSREQLGEQWLDAYLTAPIWHFAAGPGGLAETGVIGTLIPSVDRVGRHFPFLVLSEYTGCGLSAWRQPEWASAMEDVVLAVLDDQWEEALWQQRLAEIALPELVAPRLRWPLEEGNLMLPAAAREEDWLQALLARQSGSAFWWTQGSAYVEAATLLTDGLPKVGQFAAMLVGHWPQHGWQQGTLLDSE